MCTCINASIGAHTHTHTDRVIALSLSQSLLNEHEVLTLARHYGIKRYPLLTTLVQLIQNDLQKQNYTGLESLEAAIASCDHDGVGYISRDQLRLVCHSVGLPLSDQLIDGTLMK